LRGKRLRGSIGGTLPLGNDVPKKYKKSREKREEKLLLLTELTSVTVCDGVFIVAGKASDHLRTVAVTPGYARALSAAFAKCLAETDGDNVVSIRAPQH
jgi:hypothetical protein